MRRRGKKKGSGNSSGDRGPQMFYDYEFDFHGCQPEDAILKIEEVAFQYGNASFLIIHGHGDGVLRTAIRQFLMECPYVKQVCPGETNNIPGGSGVTVFYT